jgi:DNA-binding PucR family transcriptional regulator
MANEPILADHRCKIILALADCKMNVSEVSRQLYMHRGTVAYQIERIKKLTGKDPLNFYDLHDLVLYVKAERNRKWTEQNG